MNISVHHPHLFKLVAISLISLMCISGCTNSSAIPHRTFTTSDLLVNLSDLPAGWRPDRSPSKAIDYLGTDDSAGIVLDAYDDPYKGRFFYNVYRFDSIDKAKSVYKDLMSVLPGKVPSEWTYRSPIADDYLLACYDWEGRSTPVCRMSARYQEYTISIYTHILPDRMSLVDLEKILRVIDSRMTHYLFVSGTPTPQGNR